jgi:hypothetical protein
VFVEMPCASKCNKELATKAVIAMNFWRLALIVLVLLTVAIAVCFYLHCAQVFVTEPSTIIRNPDEFSNRIVTVRGQVISALSIGGAGLYLLQDSKGVVIPVATYQETPDVGAILRVKGRVHKALQIGAASVVGLEEIERKQVRFEEVEKPMKVLPVRKLREDAAKYNGKLVLVQGVIKEGADILGVGYYTIADEKETLTVVTASGAPKIGVAAQVLGVYNRIAQLYGQTIDCLVEIERKTMK